jgi:hypothetical protein
LEFPKYGIFRSSYSLISCGSFSKFLGENKTRSRRGGRAVKSYFFVYLPQKKL